MVQTLDIVQFLKLAETTPVLDVRTPLEYEHARIVKAHNLPIFSNEERVLVGTCYKKQGREAAILLGFDLTGPKWSGFIKEAIRIAPNKKVLIHCWRGGMRSGAMAWALNLYGFEVYLLEGGYKKYRNWVLEQFKETYSMIVLGGMTGSGKTVTLQHLKGLGQQVIDLESLAQHQGSSYGSMGQMVQPSQEYFENQLASELCKVDKKIPLWLEDESLSIGKCFIPKPFFLQMRQASLIKIMVPLNERVNFLLKEYGELDKEFLIQSTQRIAKRLGPEQTRDAILAIKEHRMEVFIKLILVYYDKTYVNGQSKRSPESIHTIECPGTNGQENARNILKSIHEFNLKA